MSQKSSVRPIPKGELRWEKDNNVRTKSTELRNRTVFYLLPRGKIFVGGHYNYLTQTKREGNPKELLFTDEGGVPLLIKQTTFSSDEEPIASRIVNGGVTWDRSETNSSILSVDTSTTSDSFLASSDNSTTLTYCSKCDEESILDVTIIHVASGFTHSLFLSDDGVTLWGVGNNTYGQVDPYSARNCFYTPHRIKLDSVYQKLGSGVHIIGITCGPFHSGIVFSNGKAALWGSNTDGELGNGTTESSCISKEISILSILGVDTAKRGNVRCGNCLSKLLRCCRSNKILPERRVHIRQMSLGIKRSAACTNDDQTYVWGKDEYISESSTTPVRVECDKAASVHQGHGKMTLCISKMTRQLWQWGNESPTGIIKTPTINEGLRDHRIIHVSGGSTDTLIKARTKNNKVIYLIWVGSDAGSDFQPRPEEEEEEEPGLVVEEEIYGIPTVLSSGFGSISVVNLKILDE